MGSAVGVDQGKMSSKATAWPPSDAASMRAGSLDGGATGSQAKRVSAKNRGARWGTETRKPAGSNPAAAKKGFQSGAAVPAPPAPGSGTTRKDNKRPRGSSDTEIIPG